MDMTDIDALEKDRNLHYVAEWPIKEWSGGYPITLLIVLFWSEKEYPDGSHWVAVSKVGPHYSVYDGLRCTLKPVFCTVSDEGQVLYSKYSNDYRPSRDKSVIVDGGPDYMRIIGRIRNPTLWLVPGGNGELQIIDDVVAALLKSGQNEEDRR